MDQGSPRLGLDLVEFRDMTTRDRWDLSHQLSPCSSPLLCPSPHTSKMTMVSHLTAPQWQQWCPCLALTSYVPPHTTTTALRLVLPHNDGTAPSPRPHCTLHPSTHNDNSALPLHTVSATLTPTPSTHPHHANLHIRALMPIGPLAFSTMAPSSHPHPPRKSLHSQQ